MATYSTYKNLEKPLSTEKYNVGVANKNVDVIDSELLRLDLKNESQDNLLATKESLNTETARATAKEDSILNDLRMEIIRAESSENEIADSLTDEITRAITSETALHDNFSTLITELTTRLNVLADSDDTTLDQLSEIVSYIKNNKDLIDNITTGKINVSDIMDTLTSTASDKPLSANQGKVLDDKKVDKVSGMGLSTNDYTTAEKNKLSGIASGAEVNVQPDWNETDEASGAFIKNKPDITASETLKNALTFTGRSTESYDGSAAISVKIPEVYVRLSEINETYDFTNFSYNMLPTGSILYCTVNSGDKEAAFDAGLIPIQSVGVITAVNAASRGYVLFTTDSKRMFFASSNNMKTAGISSWIELSNPIIYSTTEPTFLYPDMTWIGT